MKKFLLFLFICISVLSAKQSKATHLLGGEITWECIRSGSNTGKLIFTAKYYRKCAGSPGIGNPTIANPLYLDWGGPSTIPTLWYSTEDLSPQCYQDSLGLDCYTTAQITGAIEVRTFKSAPIHLIGVPDSNGSEFSVSSCCRPGQNPSTAWGYLRNIYGSGYYLKSMMYPFVNPATGVFDTLGTASTPTCYDSSPIFAARPVLWIDSGRPTMLDLSSNDRDLDVIEYFWDVPYKTATDPITWQANYSTLSQLPGKAHHALNIPANLDQYTGNLTITTHAPMGGLHQTCFEVKSYRCGQHIATIRREVPFSIDNHSVVTPNNNTAPTIDFIHQADTFVNFFSKTIVLGDSIEFGISAHDLFVNPNSVPQKVKLAVSGPFLADGISVNENAKIGVPILMDTAVLGWKDFSWKSFLISRTHFKWKPECVQMVNNCGLGGLATFKFTFTATDDYCRIPIRTVAKVFITVVDTSARNMYMDSLLENPTTVNLKWQKYTGSSFNKYYIYHTNSLALGAVPIDSISNVNTVNYSYQKNSTDTANYFIIKLDHNSGICTERNVYSTFNLKLKNLYNGAVQLDWNQIALGNANLNQPMYRIYRKIGTGSYSLIDSTSFNRYIDSIPQCRKTYHYKMELVDTSFYASSETQDSIYIGVLANIPIVINGNHLSYNYFIPHTTQWYRNGKIIPSATKDTFSVDTPGVYYALLTFASGCQSKTDDAQFLTFKSLIVRSNGSVSVYWNKHHRGSKYIVTYSNTSTGPFYVLDTLPINGSGYTDTSARADTLPRYYQVLLDSINSNQGTSVQRTMFIENDANNLENRLSWQLPYSSAQREPKRYDLLRKPASGTFNVVGTASDTSIVDTIPQCNITYTYIVKALDSLGFENSSNFLDVSANDPIYTTLLNQKDSLYPKYLIQDSTSNLWFYNSIIQSVTTDYYLMDSMGSYALRVMYGNNCELLTDTFNCYNPFPIPYPTNVHVDTNGGVMLKWNGVPNTDTNFIAYYVYGAIDSLGPFNLIDSITNINTDSLYHGSARADTVVWYYYINVKAFVPCLDKIAVSSYSQMVNSLGISISSLFNGNLQINWTPFFVKNNISAGKEYEIYRRYQSPNWQLIGTSPYGIEELKDTVIGCEEIIQYMVEIDSLGVKTQVLGGISISEFNVTLNWENDSVLVGLAGTTYSWYLDNVLIPGQNGPTLVPTLKGIYRLETILSNGCKAISNEVDLSTLSIIESSILNDFSVFPNPSQGEVTIQYDAKKAGELSVEVLDAKGQAVHFERFNTKSGLNTHSLTLDNLPKGLFFLVVDFDGERIKEKIVIE